MLESVLPVPFWLEFAAALTGGISGAMSAVRARFDIFGTICIACTAGLFGGVMRDLLLQSYGIYAFQHPELIIACVIAAIVVFFFGKLTTYLDPVVNLLDNLSMGLWAVISVGKGFSAGLSIVPCVILGTTTAIGGGVMRDVFMSRKPEAFQAGALYGSASLIGSIAYAIMRQYDLLPEVAPFICVGVVLIVRYMSLLLGWHTKPSHDYSDAVTQAVAKPVKSVAKMVRAAPKGKTERDKEQRQQATGRHVRSGPLAPSDPSDRIVLKDLAELRDESPPKDPFEPSTPDPRQ